MAVIGTAIHAQTAIKQQRLYGGFNEESINQICITKDSGLVLAGNSRSGKTGNKITPNKGLSDYWIIKQSKTGNK